VLGKKSGLDSVDLKSKELGLTIPAEQRAPILTAVKQRAIAKRGLLTDQEFREIVKEIVAVAT
jgi:isopropylmalate/homocitrate/citramalate synthase